MGKMPQDSNQKPERPLGLSPAQIAGSALSAVSAAFVASWAGTTGTLVGAAVGSVVATIGAALYTASLKRSSEAVRRAAIKARQASLLTAAMPRSIAEAPLRTGDGREGPEEPPTAKTEAMPVTENDDDSQARAREPGSWRNRLPWGRALLASLAVMVVAIGGITAVEAITGHPISSWLGRNDSTGTTVGNVGNSVSTSSNQDTGTDNSGTTDNKDDTDQTTPSQDAQPSSPADPEPSAKPSQVPSQEPSVSANPEPSTAP
jgi:hypothetical protein